MTIYAIATMDTKGEEIQFVVDQIRSVGGNVKSVDVGTGSTPQLRPDITRESLLAQAGLTVADLPEDRGAAITMMGESLAGFLCQQMADGLLTGVLGIGGSGGTALITAAMRQLPVGLPKLMVSTVASGNVAPYVDCFDLTMMYSVVDVAGINRVSEKVLSNAAHAIVGMGSREPVESEQKECLGMTMFGVTTPCVDAVRKHFESKGFDCLVFHAVGTGGRAMEGLVRSNMIRGVLDLTTTEVADEVVGGVFACGPNRFDSILQAKIPLVISVGAVDMVNFGALDSVPGQFRDRLLHVHNEQVTLMRTNEDENVQIGEWITSKLNQSEAGFTLLLPEKGVSLLDREEMPFFDPAADQALFATLESQIEKRDNRKIVRLPFNINDPGFSDAAIEEYEALESQ